MAEIKSLIPPENWKFVPGSKNPADLASRGTEQIELLSSDYWKHGPSDIDNEICTSEANCFINGDIVSEGVVLSSVVLKIELFDRFSSYSRMRITVGWIFRFANNCKSQTNERLKEKNLTIEEIETVERKLLMLSQVKYFQKEIECLKLKLSVPNSSCLTCLQPVIDDLGILRRDCRLSNSTLSYEQSFPIILHNSCRLTHLIIDMYHRDNFHSSIRDTMMLLRDKYWILKYRQTVKKVIHSCNLCKRQRAKSCNPPFAPLPPERVNENDFMPFSTCGVDYIGPFKLKNQMKAYILLFTCARIRSVHLEVVTSMNIDSFIRAFDIFSSRRGQPKKMISDNFTTFKLASKLLAAKQSIKWRFNTPAAPWHGGFFERLVKSVKTPLRSNLKNFTQNIDKFRHIVTKIEFLVNSRPLTTVYDSNKEIIPLTPNDFLIFRGQFNSKEKLTCDTFRKLFINSLRGYKQLWYRWRQEYLRMLKIVNRNANSLQLKPGDIVLLEGEGPRYSWPLAKVTNVKFGADNVVRSAEVRTSKGRLLWRPVKRLYLLEFNF